MNRQLWRIATDTLAYTADDLSGAGSMESSGRWNAVGETVLYTSETQSLACLETLVHINSGLPFNRYLVEITVPAAVWRSMSTWSQDRLPVGWDAEPAGRVSVFIGSDWLRNGSHALLRVPSVIIPDECNVVINPLHPAAAAITACKVRRWLYDPRLARST